MITCPGHFCSVFLRMLHLPQKQLQFLSSVNGSAFHIIATVSQLYLRKLVPESWLRLFTLPQCSVSLPFPSLCLCLSLHIFLSEASWLYMHWSKAASFNNSPEKSPRRKNNSPAPCVPSSIYHVPETTVSIHLRSPKVPGWEDGLVHKSTYHLSMRTWVQIPSAYTKCQGWQCSVHL